MANFLEDYWHSVHFTNFIVSTGIIYLSDERKEKQQQEQHQQQRHFYLDNHLAFLSAFNILCLRTI